jgi:hypothetical protein
MSHIVVSAGFSLCYSLYAVFCELRIIGAMQMIECRWCIASEVRLILLILNDNIIQWLIYIYGHYNVKQVFFFSLFSNVLTRDRSGDTFPLHNFLMPCDSRILLIYVTGVLAQASFLCQN